MADEDTQAGGGVEPERLGVGKSVRFGGEVKDEANANSPMTISEINAETGMATLKRENTVVGEYPTTGLEEVPPPVDVPPPLYPPDAVVEAQPVAPSPEPLPSEPPVEPPPTEPPTEPEPQPNPNL